MPKPVYLIFYLILLSACSLTEKKNDKKFEVSSILKNDIDSIAETHQRTVFEALDELALKLYKRNPAEWRKGGFQSREQALNALSSKPPLRASSLESIAYIRSAFDVSFQGDRVKTLVIGLKSMVFNAYDNKRTFYLLDLLDAQKLYHSARNLELASWLLRTRRDEQGRLLLVSSEGNQGINLSFERLFGKMINSQDMLAQIIADRSNRQIKYIIQSAMTAFIPI